MRSFIIRNITLLCLLVGAMTVLAQQKATLPCTFEPTMPKYEIRAVWLATIGGIDWPHSYKQEPQKKELCQILDSLKKVGINTVIMQARVRATTIYSSSLEPWDGCITGTPGKSPGYDPLAFAIDECHKRGMQLHAWVVTIPVGKWNGLGCSELRRNMPGLIKKIGEEGFMDPESEQTGEYLAKVCGEIVDKYDVDGIHLDYIRYPEKWKLRVSRSKGREYITNIVKAISKEVKTKKPWVMLSCSPIGKHDDLLRYRSNGWNARTAVCQDAQQWLSDGLMDALFPMMYFRNNQFFPFAIDWQEHANGRLVVPGLGIYFMDPREGNWKLGDVTRQLYVSRGLGIGHCFFRSDFLTRNTADLYSFMKHFNTLPALVPPMTWCSKQQPKTPTLIGINKDGRLEWENDSEVDSLDYVYNVYASSSFPVDVTNANNLMVTRLKSNSLLIDNKRIVNYAVTAQDRFGNESRPAQLRRLHATTEKPDVEPMVCIVDKTLRLPARPNTLDAYDIIIETIAGKRVAVLPYRSDSLDVSFLDEGCYQWRTLGKKKKRNHRMGFFNIKRSDLP